MFFAIQITICVLKKEGRRRMTGALNRAWDKLSIDISRILRIHAIAPELAARITDALRSDEIQPNR